MININRTNSSNPDFVQLVVELDNDLAIRDGEDHAFYNQFNKIGTIKHVVVVYENNQSIACGALKEYAADIAEVKRMYVVPEKRGKGFASLILTELENWAKELNYKKCILETGKNQPEAITLYKKNNYKIITNYGHYAGIENSVCFEKVI